jgi:hypothetical protein
MRLAAPAFVVEFCNLRCIVPAMNRPASLLADPAYGIPKLPFALDWSSVPELIRVATLDLGGIQPVTKAHGRGGGRRDVARQAKR